METDRDWDRLGRAFAKGREEAHLTQVEAAERLGVSRGPIQNIERGRTGAQRPSKVTGTMRSYARLLGWADGSIERVLAGGEPEVAPTPAPASPEEHPPSDLSPDVQMELRSGRTLGSQILHLGPPKSDARAIIILKGAEDITDEELDQIMQDWRKRRRRLQGIATDPEDN
ncbi:helix-turn-helix transcriptional regulator [Streptomyces sp. NPDC058268]|uniref:helix-turn-helix transcriptional regulator n=1 Tax=Streptomyces sp. NPDC058268 TaxID=3346413 RepID=UPI0036EE478D